MKTYEYNDVQVVAEHDPATGLLVVSALLDGVAVPIAAQKHGHFAPLFKEARRKRLEAEEAKASAPGTATEVVPVAPHSVTEPVPTTPASSPTVTQ